MAASGVDGAVLVPLDAHDDYVAGALDDHPKTFAAIAVAKPAELRAGGARGEESSRPTRSLRLPRLAHWLGEPGRPVTGSPAFPVLRYLAGQDMLLWTYLPPDQLPLLSGVVRELPKLRVVLNHLGFCPQDMQIDEHRRPRFDDAFPESTVQQVLRLSEAGGVHLMVSRPIRPVDAGTSVPRPVPGDPPFRRGIRTRAPAVGFGLPGPATCPATEPCPTSSLRPARSG